MPYSLKELKRLYKQCKQLYKTLLKLYKTGAVLRMLQPRAELENAETMMAFYKEKIDNYVKE